MDYRFGIGTGFLVLLLVHCGGGGDPEPVANESALPAVIKAAPFYPDEMNGIDITAVSVSAVLQTPVEETKSALRDITTPVQASVSDGQWRWTLGAATTGDYMMQLTYQVQSIPIASAAFPVRIENGSGTVAVTRDSFTDVGGGDLDDDGLTNLREVLRHTDPAKADTDDDGLNDGAEITTDPLKADTDDDGVKDKQDIFPIDPTENKDSDGDGVGDRKDNCMVQTNPAQVDVDHDGKGDACDAVNDDIQDTDNDGMIDKYDDFPLDPDETRDSDRDAVGDNADNCRNVANTDQTNTDKVLANAGITTVVSGIVVPVTADGSGDACDDDPDGDGRNVVYVDGTNGDDAKTGYYQAPVKTITRGMLLAEERQADVWVAAGDYDVGQVVWLKGTRIFGGYSSGFNPNTRDFLTDDTTYRTRLLAAGKATVLALQNLSTDTRFDGFHVTADAIPVTSGGTVAIDNSVVTLANCTIVGNNFAGDDAAVRVLNNGFATLSGDSLSAKGSAMGIGSTGLWTEGSTLTVDDTMVEAGWAPHAIGVYINTSTATMDQITVTAQPDIKTQQFVTGIWLAATAPRITNSKIVIATTGVPVEGIYFETGASPPGGTEIRNTSVFVGNLPNANPLLRDWDGVPYTTVVNGDFQAMFADGFSTKMFAELVGANGTGGNAVGDGN